MFKKSQNNTLEKIGIKRSSLNKRQECTLDTPKCPIESWSKNKFIPVMPSCCVNHLKEVIFYLHDLFEEQGIHYWIDFGTLLGAVRNGKTIPHDTDGDFGLYYNYREPILNLRERIEQDGLKMFIHHSKGNHERVFHGDTVIRIARSPINHMTVDLFFWKYHSFTGALTSDGLNSWKSFPDWFVKQRVPIRLFDRDLWGPRDTEAFLRFRYGHDWAIPKKKKINFASARETHKGIFQYAALRANPIKML
jgi:hypothetical protein